MQHLVDKIIAEKNCLCVNRSPMFVCAAYKSAACSEVAEGGGRHVTAPRRAGRWADLDTPTGYAKMVAMLASQHTDGASISNEMIV